MRVWLIAKILLHPLRYAQERIDAWVLARVKREAGPITIGRRRVYILPTGFGYGFALMAFVMLMGAMNYSNSMAYALTFLLAGLGLVCMHQTHGNLVNLRLRSGHCEPVFVGETAHYEIIVDNPADSARHAIGLSWPKQEASAECADVPPRAATHLRLSQPALRRGWMPARIFSLFTEFPLGLFHAWTWAELELSCLVYPRPAPRGLEPPSSAGGGGHASGGRSGQDEFAGLRTYQRGDSLRSIHWKSLPKQHTPMTKEFSETLDRETWLEWTSLPQLDAEARLSQLTRWVLDLEQEQGVYGLRLPGVAVPPSRGEVHLHRCLKALALYAPP